MRSIVRSAAVLLVLLSGALVGPGCGGKKSIVDPGTNRTLKLDILFPGTLLGRGAPRPAFQRATSGADTLRIWVLDDTATPATMIESLTVALSKGTLNPKHDVVVRDAARYRVRVVATGERQRAGTVAPTTRGIQYLAETVSTPTLQIENVPIDMLDAVPRPAARATASGDSVSWSAVNGASSYRVSDSTGVLVTHLAGTEYGTTAFRSAYRIAANLDFGPTAAASEPVTPGRAAATITAVTPTSVPAQNADFDLVVDGLGFANLAVVLWNGTELATTFESTTRVRARVPNALFPAPGSASVRVRNPDGLVSAPRAFPITARRPVITTFTPPNAIAGDPTFTLTVEGAAFVSGATVVWAGVNLPTTFVSATQLTAQVAAARFTSVGPAAVEVVNPGGERSDVASYVVVAEPVPTITAVEPDTVQVGSGGFTITLDGTAFRVGAVATLNDGPLATTVVNATRITAPIPAESLTTVRSLVIRVRNPVVALSGPASLHVVITPPSISSFSPSSAIVGRPSFVLTATGTDFISGAQIYVNGQPLVTTFLSSSSLSGTVVNTLISAVGTLPVAVRNPDGQLSSTVDFPVYPDPWASKTSAPIDRWGFGSSLVPPFIFVAGGWFGSGGSNVRMDIQTYNTASNTWAARDTVPASLLGVGTALVNGKMYFIANNRWPDTTWVYTPTSGAWAQEPGIPETAWDCAVAAVGNVIYAIGGDGPVDPWPAQNTVRAFDTVTHLWSTRTAMPTARSGAAVAVISGKIYVAGGTNDVQDLKTLEVYDPVANSWATLCSMPEGRSFCKADAVGGKLYVFGGSGSTPFSAVYDPATDRWSTLTLSRFVRRNHVVHSDGSLLYVFGGRGSTQVGRSLETYTPGTESAAQQVPCGTARIRRNTPEGTLLERRFTRDDHQYRELTQMPTGR